MEHVTALTLSIDTTTPLCPVIVPPDLDRYPEWEGDFGAHLVLGSPYGSIQIDVSPRGYENPARILERIAHLEAACAALRTELLAAAEEVARRALLSDTPAGIEDDVAGEAVEA